MARLAKGNSGDVLTMGADEPAWAAAAGGGMTVATGSYTGNATGVRQITTGFQCSLVIVGGGTTLSNWVNIPSITVRHSGGAHADETGACYLHATDGFVVGDNDGRANANEVTYYYWAISV